MEKRILKKFLAGECSREEQQALYDWMSDPVNKDHVNAAMKSSWDSMSETLPYEVHDKKSYVLDVLKKNNDLQLPSGPIRRYQSNARQRGVTARFWKIAASVVLIIGLGLAAYHWNDSVSTHRAMSYVEKSNPIGRKSTVVLPDGTRVKLNSDSKIYYPANFSSDNRKVVLEGEAFFEVTKDANRPFIVQTREISTTVLGTSFNVQAFAESNEITVAVLTGKVGVSEIHHMTNDSTIVEDFVFLTPDQMATYNRQKGELVASLFDREEVLGWKDGILVFKNADQEEIAKKLKNWYGLEVEFESKTDLIKKRYTGKFDNNSLEYVLKAISYTSDISFEIEENRVILKKK